MTNANKQVVTHALAELIRTRDPAVLDSLLHPDFLHHRPDATRSKAEWLNAVRALPLAELRVEIHHLLADETHVVMHSTRSLASGGPVVVGVDMWRVENGLIVEAWEILEPIAAAASNMLWWQALAHRAPQFPTDP